MHGKKSVFTGFGFLSAVEKFLVGWVVGGTVKITMAPGPDHLILNWNKCMARSQYLLVLALYQL